MTLPTIGKVLKARYQIVQSLGAGVFGQTYIAVDVDHPRNPKCVVKQLKVSSSLPSYIETLRLRFLTETETLIQLGHHSQIPELIACFEEDERFYLVQEFIEGHSLSAELPVQRDLNYLWSEGEVISFLEDVLNILEFIHARGVIHCDLKPENLIRRISDNKLVLIDFGSMQPIDFGIDAELPIYRIPVTSLGYIPPEQFIGQTKPNSDIYALGMIAIQALTGLTPLQLKVDPESNEILWRSKETVVSEYLAAVISQMIRYDHERRFNSAPEVLQALQQTPAEIRKPTIIQPNYSAFYEDLMDGDQDSSSSKPSILAGIKFGLAANSLVMGLGVYSLVQNSPTYMGNEAVYKATEEFQSGDLDRAVALMRSIPDSSKVYSEAQNTIDEWENEWKIAAKQYQAAETALNQKKWSEAIQAANLIPDILYWQSKSDKLVEKAKTKIEAQTQDLLNKAYKKAESKDFAIALEYLGKIPSESSAGSLVQQKLAEYKQKRDIRSVHLLQQAYNQAEKQRFDIALKFLRQIPKNSSAYPTAQVKLMEYEEKQGSRITEDNSVSSKVSSKFSSKFSSKIESLQPQKSLSQKSTKQFNNFQPGDFLQEINI
ncbi:serine/threonine-protein kinase [Mastigocoleus sp. MO_188.B34]|uniref:serine/threonine-protein kinase n=1 Tax=Mastigocoleus sp. MO_188.B34 TaxID=3036635 RepID=UPI002633229C|nr:serine/threonine-protein kinase [Mastigocoleus sp. MO_188.B34]MDJ0696649.1 serine/threonine-protein kinase [Mastigocoleus sp. MO_188.B34]